MSLFRGLNLFYQASAEDEAPTKKRLMQDLQKLLALGFRFQEVWGPFGFRAAKV